MPDDRAGSRIRLSEIASLDAARFTELFGGVFEHSPWVARAAFAARPFATLDALHAAMVAAVARAPRGDRIALLRAHPELGARGKLTASSTTEQGGAGLDRLADDEAETFVRLNQQYRERFGFPFIIAVRGQRDRAAIREAMERRLQATPEQEQAAALAEVAKITRFRLEAMIDERS